jgi:hypothetical protein
VASSLVIYWQFPVVVAGPTALMATRVISAALLVLLALAAGAALPVLGVLAARLGRRGLRGPAVVLLASVAFLVTGDRHFGNGWPGTGGHVVTHAAALARSRSGSRRATTTRSSRARTLAWALPRTAEAYFGAGCHTGSFFTAQEPPSLAFLGRYLHQG